MDIIYNFKVKVFKSNDSYETINENVNSIIEYLEYISKNQQSSQVINSSAKIKSVVKEISIKIAPIIFQVIQSFHKSKEYIYIIVSAIKILIMLIGLNQMYIVNNQFALLFIQILSSPTEYAIKFQAFKLLKQLEPYEPRISLLLYNSSTVLHVKSLFEHPNYKQDDQSSNLFFLTINSIVDKTSKVEPKDLMLSHFIPFFRYNLEVAMQLDNPEFKYLMCRSISLISFDPTLLQLLLECDDLFDLVIELLYHYELKPHNTYRSFKNEILNYISNVMHTGIEIKIEEFISKYGRGYLNYLYSMLSVDCTTVHSGFYDNILNALVNIVSRGGSFIGLLKQEPDIYERIASFVKNNDKKFVKDINPPHRSQPVLNSFNSRCLIHIISLQLAQFQTPYMCKLILLDYPKHLSTLLNQIPFNELNLNLSVLLDATLELFRDCLSQFYEPDRYHHYSFLVLYNDFIATLKKIYADNSDFILSIQNSRKILSIVNNRLIQIKQ